MSCYVNCYANSMTILIFSVPCGLIMIILIMSNTMMGLENARKIQPVHLDATRIKLIHLFFIRNLNFGWALMFLSHSLISVLEGSYQSYGFLCAECAVCSHSNHLQMTLDRHFNLDNLYTITKELQLKRIVKTSFSTTFHLLMRI